MIIFAVTLGVVAFGILFGPMIDRVLLRAGLWMNGVDGRHADEIVEFSETGKVDD